MDSKIVRALRQTLADMPEGSENQARYNRLERIIRELS